MDSVQVTNHKNFNSKTAAPEMELLPSAIMTLEVTSENWIAHLNKGGEWQSSAYNAEDYF